MTLTGEQARVAALRALEVLDSAPEQDFDDLAALVAAICGTPMAAVGLVDSDRQWFKASQGLDVDEIPRDLSFCAHAVDSPTEVLVVPDAEDDARFRDNPLVTGGPRIRFYAGAPLVTEQGHAVGALCVLDTVPRHLTPHQQRALEVLSRQAATLLQRRAAVHAARRALRAQQAAEARFAHLFAELPSGMAVVDASGTYVQVNRALAQMLGRPAEQIPGMHDSQLTLPADHDQEKAVAAGLVDGDRDETVRQKRYLRPDGSVLHALVTTSVVRDPGGAAPQFLSQVQSIEDRRRAEHDLMETQSAHDGIITIDASGVVRAWNAGAERVFGFPAQEMVGRSLAAIVPERLWDAHRGGVAGLVGGRTARPGGQHRRRARALPGRQGDHRRAVAVAVVAGRRTVLHRDPA